MRGVSPTLDAGESAHLGMLLPPLRPPSWPRPPDGMLSRDWDLWFRFQQSRSRFYTGWYFNVRLQSSTDTSDLDGLPEVSRFRDMLAKRIDVLAPRQELPWDLIEVATVAHGPALGRLLVYAAMLRRQLPAQSFRPVLLTATLDPDLAVACGDLHVTCVVVPREGGGIETLPPPEISAPRSLSGPR